MPHRWPASLLGGKPRHTMLSCPRRVLPMLQPCWLPVLKPAPSRHPPMLCSSADLVAPACPCAADSGKLPLRSRTHLRAKLHRHLSRQVKIARQLAILRSGGALCTVACLVKAPHHCCSSVAWSSWLLAWQWAVCGAAVGCSGGCCTRLTPASPLPVPLSQPNGAVAA